MAEYVDLIFSDWIPDRGGAPWPENPGYLIDAVNVRFTPNGYRSTYLDTLASESASAVGASPIAACGFACVTTPRHYVGTAAKIYESNDYGETWNDNAGAAYSATDWDFAIFGTTIIAVNVLDNPQSKDLNDTPTTNFADLGGTPPKASRVARIRDSLVLGALNAQSYTLQWSSIGNPADWPTPGSATALARQAGSVTLQSEYGLITQLVGGEKFGLVFQERAITRMTYVGGDIQFQFDVYYKGHGSGHSHSAIRVGNLIYFLSSTGVFVTDGYTVTPISMGKVDDAFVLNLLSHPRASFNLGNGVAYDPRTKCVCWPYITTTGDDFLLCYDVVLQQFKTVDLTSSMLDNTLYSVVNGGSVTDALSVPHLLGEDSKLRRLDSVTATPTLIRTGFVDLAPGYVTDISGVEVLGASIPDSPVISIRSENDSSGIDLADRGYMATGKSVTTNRFDSRASGRFHSLKYVDSLQSKATLVRGLRVYYEVRSQR